MRHFTFGKILPQKFSDVIMPGMNGIEMARIIRERYPYLPVMPTSGCSSLLAQNTIMASN
jgi:CheY-like chemotaxis protein